MGTPVSELHKAPEIALRKTLFLVLQRVGPVVITDEEWDELDPSDAGVDYFWDAIKKQTHLTCNYSNVEWTKETLDDL